ncbi:MAG TPA: hypothetical protein GX019_07345 [Firmicutes bacterium]|nr:hypothetical protein [Bacillota bacterium]
MNKKISLLLILISVLVWSGTVGAQAGLVVGYTGSEWYTGVEAQAEARRLIGFVGYERDYASGMIAVTNETPTILGYAEIGREAFLGNLKYAVSAHGGSPDLYTDAQASGKLGVRGELLRLSGSRAYGVEAEANILGSPSLSVKPYIELRQDGILKAQVGLGTHPVFLNLTYGFSSDPQIKTSLFGTYHIGERFDYGISFTFADTLSIRQTLSTENNPSLSLSWDGVDYPFKVGIVWKNKQFQWHVSYAVKL